MKRSAVPFAAIIAVAALVFVLVYGVAAKSDDKTIDEAVKKNEQPTAPSRTLPVLGTDGQQRALADYKGKVVVLNFWASWCTPCRTEAPELEKAQKQLQQSGTGTVLGVAYQDAPNDSEKFIRQFGVTYPSLRDVGGHLAKDYGTRALPETFVVNPQGKIVALSRGTVSQQFLDDAIKKAQAS
jgi:cytochrome c biogenesis protein CcmG, thiol:disulfide interchange protein DsbE